MPPSHTFSSPSGEAPSPRPDISENGRLQFAGIRALLQMKDDVTTAYIFELHQVRDDPPGKGQSETSGCFSCFLPSCLRGIIAPSHPLG